MLGPRNHTNISATSSDLEVYDHYYGSAIRSNMLGGSKGVDRLQKLASFEYVERYFKVMLRTKHINLAQIINQADGYFPKSSSIQKSCSALDLGPLVTKALPTWETSPSQLRRTIPN